MTYDRQLAFSRHAALVGNGLKHEIGAQQKLASTSWACDCQTVHTTYITTRCSKVEYGTSSWLLWISSSMLENLERSQRYVGQTITGHLCTTHVEAILAQANLPSIERRAIQQRTNAMEKSPRTTVTNSRQTTATQATHYDYGNAPKSLSGVKKQMYGKKSSVILNPPRYPHLSLHGFTPALTPMS